MAKRNFWVVAVLALSALSLTLPVMGAQGTKADKLDADRADQISRFNVFGPFTPEVRASDKDILGSGAELRFEVGAAARRPLGAALSTAAGIGPGVSVDLTYDDWQWGRKHGRYVSHYWNGEFGETMEVDVHFVYDEADTSYGSQDSVKFQQAKYSGYNVYDASVPTGNWPRDQEIGCDLQATDTLGTGSDVNLALTNSGLAIMAARSRFFRSFPDTGRIHQNMIFYQGARHNCTFDPRSNLNTTYIDSTLYRPNALEQPGTGANYGWDPQVATTWDGTNDIVHVLLVEDGYQSLPDNDHLSSVLDYKCVSYYRKVGSTSSAGSWSSGQRIDTTWYHGYCLATGPFPHHDKLAVSYTNPSYYGGLLNHEADLDCWIRESFDGGLTWAASRSITNYTNAIAGDPKHFTCWIESYSMFDLDGNLHVIWAAKPTSADPYFDGFNWQDFDENIYHWASHEPTAIVKIANGNFMNDDMLTGSMNTLHCGFGGVNAGYLAFMNLSECDDKLYCVWNQIHERANRFPWRDAPTQPAPGVLDDCAYDAPRLSAANFEILMSVAQVATPSLWDAPRNITATYTPACGLPGDPEADGPCGSEYKPSVEVYGLDETALAPDLTWPSNVVDLSPGQTYSGDFYLNMIYHDDQYPGSFWRPDLRGNTTPTKNSQKWVRLACVEPIQASRIDAIPETIEWPEWVMLGASEEKTITVVNEGNVTLNVTEIGFDDNGGGWLSVSENPSPGSPFTVTAGVVNTRTFTATLDATSLVGTQWLDGEIWLLSDAANFDSISIKLHVLAAANVESVAWDTVTTHEYMFDEFFEPEGACVALGVGNNGDLGWGAGSVGGINLDYEESGLECGTRVRDGYYLFAGTAYTILAAASDGSGAELTQVHTDANQADETGFDPTPAKGSIRGGLTANQAYDSVYTGQFVNRDTTVAMERTVYGPRSSNPQSATLNFIVVSTKAYSANGQAHSHLTFGNACDFDVPASDPPNNNSFVSVAGNFVYLQGTDTAGWNGCQPNTTRFGTEAFGGGYTGDELAGNPCVNGTTFHGSRSAYQLILEDTTHYRDGTDLIPDQPNPLVWWQEVSQAGVSASDLMDTDLAIFTTYVHDYDLAADDTLYYWTVLSTVRNGTLEDLETQVAYAKNWYMQVVRGCG
ncbi:MAG: hypothetical protein AB1772_10865, partial [Candidatus Zixiibacteriota bacterium]